MSKIILTGPKFGVKKLKELRDPDILKSKFLKYICDKNHVTLSKKNNKVFIYHNFDCTSKDYTGRWYNTDLKKIEYTLNENEKLFTYIIPEYEDYEKQGKITKNIKLEIYFTEKGWKKLMKILG